MEPAEEPPTPEQANVDMGMTDATRPERAPEALSAAPATHVLEATDTSSMYSSCSNTEGCVSSCLMADGFCFNRALQGRG